MDQCFQNCQNIFFNDLNLCVENSNCDGFEDQTQQAECLGSCYEFILPSYESCLNSCSSSSSTSFNVVQSVNGANVKFNEAVVASKVGEPMFHWYGQLLNTAITFFPVVLVVSMFWLIYGWLKHLGNKNSLESKKSLDNK